MYKEQNEMLDTKSDVLQGFYFLLLLILHETCKVVLCPSARVPNYPTLWNRTSG